MDLLQLRCFCVVAKYENCSRAANELCVSQPAVSNMISRLEAELGVSLFDRVGRSLRLNTFGHCFYEDVQDVLKRLDKAQERLQNLSKPTENILLWSTAGIMFTTELLQKFSGKYPNVKVVNINPSKTLNARNSCDAEVPDYDIVFWSAPDAFDAPSAKCVLSENFLLVTPLDHELSKRRGVDVSSLSGYPLISCAESSSIGRAQWEIYEKLNLTANVVYKCTTVFSAVNHVQNGLGITLLPDITIRKFFKHLVAFAKIQIPDGAHRDIYLSFSEDKYVTNGMRLFADFTEAYFRDLSEQYKMDT